MTTQNNQASGKRIILSLSNQTNVVDLDVEQIFQQEARISLFKKIEEQLNQLDNEKINEELDEIFYERYHNAITICGSRGSGKSTLIRHVLSSMHKASKGSYNEDPSDNVKVPSTLSVLPVIDPTLIASKEHVLIILISQIREKVNNKHNKASENDVRDFDKALKKLSGGLCQIDGIGSSTNYGDEWEDKSYILEIGLSKATEGRQLELNLNDFIVKALKVINKKAFVVTFDDIDTQFERGWPVLETVRKYLTSLKLVVLISGDIELYQKLVRSAQFESVGRNILEYDRPSISFHKSTDSQSFDDDALIKQITDLEEQYLMKVLKPENRVHMLTLQQRKIKNGYDFGVDVSIQYNNSRTQASVENYLSVVSKIGFGISRSQEQQAFVSAIMNLPARTLMQVMKATTFIVNILDDGTVVANYDTGSSVNKNEFENFVVKIIDSFSSTTNGLKISLADIKTSQFSLNKLAQLFWQWGIKQDIWERFSRLSPTSPSETLNNRILMFLVLVNNHIQFSAGSALEWMLIVSLPKNIASDFKDDGKNIDITKVISYLGIGDNYVDINETTNRAQLSLIKNDDGKTIKPENFGLYRVPFKDVGLDVEVMLLKFYRSKELTDISKNIKDLELKKNDGNASQKEAIVKEIRALRYRVKDIIYYSFSKKSEMKDGFYTNPLLGEWHEQMQPFFENMEKENDSGSVKESARVSGIFYNRLHDITSSNYDLGQIANLALLKTSGYIKSQDTGFVSVLTLFSNIILLLKKNISSEQELKIQLAEMYNQGKIQSPDWSISIDEEEAYTTPQEEGAISQINKYSGGFFNRILKWIEAVNKNWPSLHISSSSLSRVIDNYYSFAKEVDHDRSLGSLVHGQIVSLFHAALIEDSYRKNKINTGVRAVRTTEREFFENYKKYFNEKPEVHLEKLMDLSSPQDFSLFTMLVSCPILGIFLRQTPKNYTHVPKSWNWLTAHACNFILLCESDSVDLKGTITQDEKMLNDISVTEMINELDSPRLSVKRKASITVELREKTHKNRNNLIISYLNDLKVHGEVENNKIVFTNLFPLLNTVPIMGGSFHRANVSVNLTTRPVKDEGEKSLSESVRELSDLADDETVFEVDAQKSIF